MTYKDRIREWDGRYNALRRRYDDLRHDAYLNVEEGIMSMEDIVRVKKELNEEMDELMRELDAIEREYGDRSTSVVEVEYGRR